MTAWSTCALVLILASGAAGSSAIADADGDGLPDDWEERFGLNAASAAGEDGAAGDPDGDGLTNLQELDAGTHPRGFLTRYLAEGATNAFFDTSLALLNPAATPGAPVHVLLRFLKSDGTQGRYDLTIPAGTRRTVRPATVAGMANSDFSTVIEADGLVVVDRTMTWDGLIRYGSHADTAILGPSTTWYLAEGSTSDDFNLFYLLQNPNAAAAQATVRYLLPFGQPPIEKVYTLPPESRTTIYVDAEGGLLASTDVSSVITADAPILVERAMYKDRPFQAFAAGHESAGVTRPAVQWFLAEGATGPFFDEFVLIANPNAVSAEVSADYLLMGGGLLTKQYTVPAFGRFTIWVDDEELPAGSGQKPLANVAVSTTVRSTNGVPVIVERAMWWPGPETTPNFWYEAHNSPGATFTGTRWALADGEAGGPWAMDTYILIANTSESAGQARVTLFFEDGTSVQRTYDLPIHSRTNVAVGADFPEAVGRTFGAVVESVGNDLVQIVVERAMYSNVPGDVWSAGTNALATPLPSDDQFLDRLEGPSGTIVRLHGHGFTSATDVRFGNVRVPMHVISDTEIRFVVPFEMSAGHPRPLAIADAVPVRVDGLLVRTFKVTALPETGLPPGQVLSTTITRLNQDWTSKRGEVETSLTRVRDAMSNDAVRALVDDLIAVLPLVDKTHSDYLPPLATELDAQTLAILERVLTARGGFGLASHAASRAAASVPRLPALKDANAFLEARRVFVQASNDADDAGLLLDAVCALTTPTVVISVACALGAGGLGVGTLMFDSAINEIGGIEEFSIREGDREGPRDTLRVVVPPNGTTISAHIKIQRKFSPTGSVLFTLSRLVNLSKTGPVLASERALIEKLEKFLIAFQQLQRLGFIDPPSIGLDVKEELGPVSFQHVQVTPGASSQLFGLPAISIDATGRVEPRVQEGFQSADFSLKTTIATHSESATTYGGFFRMSDIVSGRWTGNYQYTNICANFHGIEQLDLTLEDQGVVTGTIFDIVIGPSAGTASGHVIGSLKGKTLELDVFYTAGTGSQPNGGVRSHFKADINGNTMTGKTGMCATGADVTLTRQ